MTLPISNRSKGCCADRRPDPAPTNTRRVNRIQVSPQRPPERSYTSGIRAKGSVNDRFAPEAANQDGLGLDRLQSNDELSSIFAGIEHGD
jgi:hypothetical protein